MFSLTNLFKVNRFVHFSFSLSQFRRVARLASRLVSSRVVRPKHREHSPLAIALSSIQVISFLPTNQRQPFFSHLICKKQKFFIYSVCDAFMNDELANYVDYFEMIQPNSKYEFSAYKVPIGWISWMRPIDYLSSNKKFILHPQSSN